MLMKPESLVKYFFDTFDLLPRDEWLKLRRGKVTASEVGCLIGYNKWKTAFDIYEDKVLEKESKSTLTMERGNYLEPLIAKEYARVTGAKMYAPFEIRNGERWERLLEHPTDDRRAATPDYFAATDVLKYVEIKDVSYYGQINWIDGMPEGYSIQVQYNLNIINTYLRILKQPPITCDLAYWWNDRVEIVSDIKEDEEKVEIIAKIAQDFFDNHIIPGIYPQPEKWTQASRYYNKSSTGETITATPDTERMLTTIAMMQGKSKDLKSEASLIDESIERSKLEIAAFMKEAEILLNEHGEILATWKPDKNGNRRLSIKVKSPTETEGW